MKLLRPLSLARHVALLALAACGAAGAWAQAVQKPATTIFQCTTAQGRKLTSDRLIAECNDREQRVYSTGGLLVRVLAPPLTAEERQAADAKREREHALVQARAENQRRDRQLQLRFSNENSHRSAREQALGPVDAASNTIKKRLELLDEDKIPLDREAEFYAGKKLPLKLKQQYDTIEATQAGLKTALKAQAEERSRINQMYDIELERLKKLWAGVAPGTLGPLPVPAAMADAPSSSEQAVDAVDAAQPKATKRKDGGGSG